MFPYCYEHVFTTCKYNNFYSKVTLISSLNSVEGNFIIPMLLLVTCFTFNMQWLINVLLLINVKLLYEL